ncbi:MAG: PEPxxWA-CTERM sorting domain-containing protein [Caulobacteraceae bacterium]|nr:PEPxxWA-CTERM sorting domain-containing protein [Caulobacteraceae bacterium]
MTASVAVALAMSLGSTAALADSINFGQPSLTSFTGVTNGGVSFTLNNPGNGYSILTQGSSWNGDFSTGAPVLFDNYTSGAVVFSFASPISSLTNVGIEANFYGPYTGTLAAYNAAGALVSEDVINFSSSFAPGTIPMWSVSGPGIVTVVASATDDGDGIGLGPSSLVPEPASWAMMLVGIAALGATLRVARKAAPFAAG